jgi:hypothetical protein
MAPQFEVCLSEREFERERDLENEADGYLVIHTRSISLETYEAFIPDSVMPHSAEQRPQQRSCCSYY